MITFKSRNGRLGEVINLIYGLFYFCIRNDIPFENIVLNKNYTGKAFDSNKLFYVIKDNFPIFDNIKKYFIEKDDFEEFLIDNDFEEYSYKKYYFDKPIQLDLTKNYILSDYWHMPMNKKLFHALFKPIKVINELKSRYQNIDFKKCCACHIRRGDFKFIQNDNDLRKTYKNKIPLNSFQIKSKLYDYQEKINDMNIIIFSDDIKWCKNNLSDKYIYMENNKPYEDLSLIGMCKDFIILNESFFSYMGMMLQD